MKVKIGSFSTQEKCLENKLLKELKFWQLFVPAEDRTQGFVHATQALYHRGTSPATAHLIRLFIKKRLVLSYECFAFVCMFTMLGAPGS